MIRIGCRYEHGRRVENRCGGSFTCQNPEVDTWTQGLLLDPAPAPNGVGKLYLWVRRLIPSPLRRPHGQ